MTSLRLGVAPLLLVAAVATEARADEAAFRSRNPFHWTAVDFDSHGRLRHARTDDPAIVGSGVWNDDDVSRLRGVLQINRDDLGGTADEREPTRVGTSRLGFMLFDESTAQVTGFAQLRRTGKTLDITVAHVTLDTDGAVRRLVGKRVAQTVTLGHGPRRDCAMSSGGARNCRPRIVRTLHRDVVLAADEVSAALSLRAVNGAIHLTVCVTAEHPAPADATGRGLDVIANQLAGVPVVFDAVTQRRLPIHPARCEL